MARLTWMKRYSLASLAASTCLSAGAAFAQCTMPDPPVFRAQGKLFDFAALAPDLQAVVQAFETFPSAPLELVAPDAVTRFDDGTPQGHADTRTPEERYLQPDHPGSQPDVPQSAWKRVNCVTDIVTFRHLRPALEAQGAVFRALPQVEMPTMARTSYIKTPMPIFPVDIEVAGVKSTLDPFARPPGTNMLPTAYRNLRDKRGGEMVNTLPSAKKAPYNLHDQDPTATRINPESPIDDLRYVMETLYEIITEKPYRELLMRPDGVDFATLVSDAEFAAERLAAARSTVDHHLRWAIDMIEGNGGDGEPGSAVPGDRGYLGFPLLNHSGHKRVKRVLPVMDADGRLVGGEVTVRQVWYGGRIQSDTMFYDFGWNKVGPAVTDYANCGGEGQPSQQACENAPPIPPNKPWTIRYEISVLNRGTDDFSPMTMQFDCPRVLMIGGADQPCAPVSVDLPEGAVDWDNGALYASLDQSFFPMAEGTKVLLNVKMAPPQYFNLTYTWGWRVHPPRAQATENGQKLVPPYLPSEMMFCHPLRAGIIDHERFVFEGFPGPDHMEALPPMEELGAMMAGMGLPPLEQSDFEACLGGFETVVTESCTQDPSQDICAAVGFPAIDQDALALAMVNARLGLLTGLFGAPDPLPEDYAISKISDLAPAKRMWRAFRMMQAEMEKTSGFGSPETWISLLLDARDAYLDWLDRTHLPSGLEPDPDSDLTLLYVNNTIYGQLRKGGYVEFHDWRRRGDVAKITLLNGDYFPHGYLNVDFGGLRGWENLWQSAVKTAGSGPWFTFGRFHARFNTVPGSIAVGPASRTEQPAPGGGEPVITVTPDAHRLMIQFNFEPSPRLRFYQFDPLHHDAAIYSMH